MEATGELLCHPAEGGDPEIPINHEGPDTWPSVQHAFSPNEEIEGSTWARRKGTPYETIGDSVYNIRARFAIWDKSVATIRVFSFRMASYRRLRLEVLPYEGICCVSILQ